MPDRAPDPICTLLRELRYEAGWSLAEVERESDGRWHPSVLGSYERGTRQPTVRQVRELLDWYGYDLVAVPVGERAQPATAEAVVERIRDLVGMLPREASDAA